METPSASLPDGRAPVLCRLTWPEGPALRSPRLATLLPGLRLLACGWAVTPLLQVTVRALSERLAYHSVPSSPGPRLPVWRVPEKHGLWSRRVGFEYLFFRCELGGPRNSWGCGTCWDSMPTSFLTAPVPAEVLHPPPLLLQPCFGWNVSLPSRLAGSWSPPSEIVQDGFGVRVPASLALGSRLGDGNLVRKSWLIFLSAPSLGWEPLANGVNLPCSLPYHNIGHAEWHRASFLNVSSRA